MGGVRVSSEGSNRLNQNNEEEVLKITEETFFIRTQHRTKLKAVNTEIPFYTSQVYKPASQKRSPEITYSRFIRFKSFLL